MKITSRENSLLRRARAVRDGKIKDSIFIEGLRLCEEAVSSEISIEAVIFSERLARKQRASELLQWIETKPAKVASVSEKLLESISFTKTPQGIIMLATRPASDEQNFKLAGTHSPLLVVMHELANPVNVGAIIRTAEAAGVNGIVATLNTADPFSPKALRGAMGSSFRVPVWIGVSYTHLLAWCAAQRIQTVSAAASAVTDYTSLNWKSPSALIVGPESTGLSASEIELADKTVGIPMKGAVESLNVAVATGILLYEAARQRSQK